MSLHDITHVEGQHNMHKTVEIFLHIMQKGLKSINSTESYGYMNNSKSI